MNKTTQIALITGGAFAAISFLLSGEAHGDEGIASEGDSTHSSLEGDITVSTPQELRDLEAATRMIYNENPSAGQEVWVEQIYTQMRRLSSGESLYQQITGHTDTWGHQDKKRPVSTYSYPDPTRHAVYWDTARGVLDGSLPSKLEGARKYFDPGEQDAVYRQVEKGREMIKNGQESLVSARTKLLISLGYRLNAQGVRDKWTKEGARQIGTIGPVEFWS